jgi:signal transduction histidine kinase
MTRRLYLRLYVAFLGVLLAVLLVSTAVNVLIGRPFFGFVRGGARMALHLSRVIPPLDRPEQLAKVLDDLHDELDIDVTIVGPQGQLVASVGTPITIPGELGLMRARQSAGWLPERGIIGAPLRTPGAVMLARLPAPEGAGRSQAVRTLLLLLGTLIVSLALVYPLSRSITRPVEQLTAAVEAYGHGDLSKRSGLGNLSDEVGQLARTFDEMADRISAARRAEKELLANVSHELRTPLARINVALALIDAPDEPLRKRLQVVTEELDELDRLVGDVLTASRLDLAALPLRKTTLTLASVVEKSRARALALEPGLRVEAQVEPELTVQADDALVSRALDNLLDNARKYGKGSPIDVVARRDGAQALIAVRDRGPGFPAEELSRVFDPFFRGEASRGEANGFGLGLALARRVAEAHGGSAKAINADGGGAKIELRFPAS